MSACAESNRAGYDAAMIPRRFPLAILPLLSLLSTAPLAGPAQPVVAMRPDSIRADVELLAHPALRGREAGTPEADLAAIFVAQRLSRLGLAGAGPGGDHLQPVPLRRLSFDRAAAGLSVAGAEPVGEAGGAFVELLGPPPPEAAGSLPVVFAGWGIRSQEPAHDDFAGLEVRGRAVLVWAGEPRLEGGRSAFAPGKMSRYSFVSTKVAAAAREGAALVLVAAPPGGRPIEESWARDAREKTRPRLVPEDAPAQPPVVYVGAALAERLFAVGGANAAALLASAGVGAPVSRPLGSASVRLVLPGYAEEKVLQHNVVAVLPGADPSRAAEAVVVSAHYDHIGADPGEGGENVVYPGADDNASGTAGVLAIAEALTSMSNSGNGPARSVVFAVFGAEEKGALGSQAYVADPWPEGTRPVAVVNLDMIGRSNGDLEEYANVVLASYSARATDLPAILDAAAGRAGIEVRKLPYLRPPGRSDDTSFSEKDVPAVMLFTGPHRDYNTPTDLPDRIDYAKAARVAQLALLAVTEIASRPAPMAWDRAMTEPPPSDRWDRPY